MRKFIVLGFGSNSNDEPGKSIYLGTDRGAAIAAVNDRAKKYARQELYELAVPEIRRHFSDPVDLDVKKEPMESEE